MAASSSCTLKKAMISAIKARTVAKAKEAFMPSSIPWTTPSEGVPGSSGHRHDGDHDGRSRIEPGYLTGRVIDGIAVGDDAVVQRIDAPGIDGHIDHRHPKCAHAEDGTQREDAPIHTQEAETASGHSHDHQSYQ